ncbi:hypothetical protein [Mangrovimonas sp. ST2L15]|uniref:hypothetical protein n=1 Tax=Mangrovimonas sp. ST2L15 TaxID=1645916 RepID=UPI0006B5273F|nr:hypothetical protein [Mangrovimonas sp. ST2L15]
MKRILLICLILGTVGCKKNKTINLTTNKELSTLIKDTLISKTLSNQTDSINLAQKPIVNYDVDFSDWKTDEIDLSQFDFLHRVNDTLRIIARDTIIMIINEPYDEVKQNFEASDFIVAHVYLKESVVELQAVAYEYSYHVLADLKTGDTISSYGQPLFSKDGNFIFTSNVDLEVGYDDNGYQLIKLDSLGFTNIKTVDIVDWGIQKASWISKDSIIYSRVTLNNNYELSSKNEKMKIK